MPFEPKLKAPRIAREMLRLVDEVVGEKIKRARLPDTTLLTIGIYGPWGAGKSTLIRALQQAFTAAHYRCLTINPWKWDGVGDLHDFVLRSVVAQSRGFDLFRGVLISARRLARRLGALAVQLVALVLGLMALNWAIDTFELPLHDVALEDLPGKILATPGPEALGLVGYAVVLLLAVKLMDGAGARVAGLLDAGLFTTTPAALGAQGLATAYQDIAAYQLAFRRSPKPLVFFIDDLDRCAPDRVAEVVESIHSLTAAGCVAFIACDRDYVGAALTAKYKDLVKYHADEAHFGRRFLEKIVQISFNLPAVSHDDIIEIGLSARPLPLVADSQAETAAETAAETDDPPGDSGEIDDEDDEPAIPDAKLKQLIGKVLEETVAPLGLNIRQVKSLSNTLKLYLRITDIKNERRAEQLCAFLFANLFDPTWLDRVAFGRADLDGTLIGDLPEVSRRLRDLLGATAELRPLYALVGRRPQNPAQPQASAQGPRSAPA